MSPTRMTPWLEQAWLTRYLDRQLASDEAAWFEAYVLEKPELLALIDADTSLRNAVAADTTLRQTSASIEADAHQPTAIRSAEANRLRQDSLRDDDRHSAARGDIPAAQSRTARPTPISAAWLEPNARRKPIAPAWLAMAASLVIGLGLGSIGTRTIAPGNTAPELVANPTRIIYDTMRGEETPPRVEHADSQSPYVLIEVAVPPGAEDITLKTAGEPDQKLTLSPDGFVNFLIERRQLPSAMSVTYTQGGNLREMTLGARPGN